MEHDIYSPWPVKWTQNLDAAQAVLGSLGSEPTTASLVPAGFDAYARIFTRDVDSEPSLETVMALIAVLTEATKTPNDCLFCVWDGYGELSGRGVVSLGSPGNAPPVVPANVLAGARVNGPFRRSYLVYEGSVLDALALAPARGSKTPDFWWPQDLSWFVATDMDLPWTFVGATANVVSALRDIPALTVDPVAITDRVSLKINGPDQGMA